MGHKLAILPDEHPFDASHKFQCLDCGCTFDIEGGTIADFVLNCRLEQELRKTDPKLRKARPILVKNELNPEQRSHHKRSHR